MLRIAGKAHVGAQIRRADKHAVDAFHVQDLRQVFQRLAGFDLHQHAHGVVSLMQVIRDAVPARGARQGAADAADARRWVAGGAYRQPRLVSVLHHRHQQGLRAHVQQLLDLHRIVPRRAHYRLAGIRGDGLELGQDGLHAVRRVLAVDQQPVKTGPGQQLCAVAAGQPQP